MCILIIMDLPFGVLPPSRNKEDDQAIEEGSSFYVRISNQNSMND